MRYFITGATGFVGGVVARKLREAGHDVNAIVRSPAKAEALRAQGVALHAGDVTDIESMRPAMRGVDGVFHIAGWYKIGVRDTRDAMRVNVDGTRNVLTLMRDLAIPKGVYTSTLAINSDTGGRRADETYRFHGRHLSTYDESKWRAHVEIADAFIKQGLPLVILQPGLIYGPGDNGPSGDAIRSFLKRQLPMLPQGTAYSWAHVDDIADVHITAMARGRAGESYNVCGPTHTLIEGMALMETLSGVRKPALSAPPAMMRVMSAFMSVVERVVRVPENYSSEFLRVSAGVTYIGDNGKARRELGYAPRDLETGLRETLAHEMQRLGMPIPPALRA